MPSLEGGYLETKPIGWVRRMRPAFAPRQFLMSDGTESIPDVAAASGFSQFGRADIASPSANCRRRPARSHALRHAAARQLDDEAAFLTWRALTSAFQVAPH